MDILKYKNKILFGFAAFLVIVGVVSVIGIIKDNTLKLKTDVVTHEAGQELVLDAATLFGADEEKAAKITFDISAVDVNTVGEYTAVASLHGQKCDIKVKVVDTTAPMVEFADRYVFTNDIANTDLSVMFAGIYEPSEYSLKLVRFEYVETLKVMDENALKALTDTIPLPADEEELKELGSEEIPTEVGIYNAVVEIADVYGNSILEEVFVIYDTTGAMIEDYPDSVVYVAEEDIDKEPTIDVGQYTITDNVDGSLSEEQITYELELRDETNHEWIVHVTAKDRAGNESKADFLVTVKGDPNVEPSKDDETTSNQGNNTTGNTGNGSTGGTTNTGTYNEADLDKDGVVTGEEDGAVITADEQKTINAGYGNVVQLDSTTYAVLTDMNGDVNGVSGSTILYDYLQNLGLQSGGMYGGYINENYYSWVAVDVVPIDNSGNDW